VQHINLVSQLDRNVEPPFSARQQLQYLAVIAGVMLLVCVGLLVSGAGLDDELKEARSGQQVAITERDGLKAQILKLKQDKSLDNEIAALERAVAFRREMLASIDPDADGGSTFSEHLTGLSRQHIEGLWFTQIQLHENGDQIVLQGNARQPEFVPRFLQKLADEPVFSGQQFKVLKMNVPEEWKGALSFEVRSLAVGAKE
jgi:hypothetical protein